MTESKPMTAEQREQIVQQVVEAAEEFIEAELNGVQIDSRTANRLIKLGYFGSLFLRYFLSEQAVWGFAEFLRKELPSRYRTARRMERGEKAKRS